MDIMIRGATMPNRCWTCKGMRVATTGEYCCWFNGMKEFKEDPRKGRQKSCPLYELPHDHWRPKYEDDEGNVYTWECPMCGEETDFKSNFCPSCGLDMTRKEKK